MHWEMTGQLSMTTACYRQNQKFPFLGSQQMNLRYGSFASQNTQQLKPLWWQLAEAHR
jgi:hypothetical protein